MDSFFVFIFARNNVKGRRSYHVSYTSVLTCVDLGMTTTPAHTIRLLICVNKEIALSVSEYSPFGE